MKKPYIIILLLVLCLSVFSGASILRKHADAADLPYSFYLPVIHQENIRIHVGAADVGGEPLTGVVVYAIDFMNCPDSGCDIVWSFYTDLLNGCTPDSAGNCTITVNEDLFMVDGSQPHRDGWVFMASSNLEMFKNVLVSPSLLYYEGVKEYSVDLQFVEANIGDVPRPENMSGYFTGRIDIKE